MKYFEHARDHRAWIWLREQEDPDQTYSVALAVMALVTVNDEADRDQIRRFADWLPMRGIYRCSGAWIIHWWSRDRSCIRAWTIRCVWMVAPALRRNWLRQW